MSVASLLYNPEKSILNILISSDSILYTISDEYDQVFLRQEINLLRSRKSELGGYEQFFNQPELNILSDNVRIIFEDSLYQIIPSEFFIKKDIKTVYEIEHGKLNRDVLNYKVLPKWRVHLIYKIPERMYRFFRDKYPKAQFDHRISHNLKKKVEKNNPAIYAFLRSKEIDIIVVDQAKLQLAATYGVATNEDILYHILNVYEQLSLDVDEFPLQIKFKDKTNETLFNLLAGYIKEIKI